MPDDAYCVHVVVSLGEFREVIALDQPSVPVDNFDAPCKISVSLLAFTKMRENIVDN